MLTKLNLVCYLRLFMYLNVFLLALFDILPSSYGNFFKERLR